MASPQVLEQVDIFYDLDLNQLEKILEVSKEAIYFQDEQIFVENTPSTEFYVILEGEVAIQVDPGLVSGNQEQHPPRTIAVLYPGQSFGEVALVDEGLRSASAFCHSMVCKTLVIRRQDLVDLFKEDHEMGFIVMENLARELCLKVRQSNLNLRQALLYMPRQES